MDLWVIYAGPPREDAYQAVRRCLKLRGLEPHVDSEQEAQAVGEQKAPGTERTVWNRKQNLDG